MVEVGADLLPSIRLADALLNEVHVVLVFASLTVGSWLRTCGSLVVLFFVASLPLLQGCGLPVVSEPLNYAFASRKGWEFV